ncbi:MAG: hypothetical protein NPIRA05_00310 [Nitrospirales bacterium]|nr:MAG: hypothetical protein NPIRA05_00310 [Nitrospirales bacterium]
MEKELIDQYRLVSVSEVAKLCGCSKATIWRRVKNNEMPQCIKIGGTTRWSFCEIQTYLRSQLEARTAIIAEQSQTTI